MSPVMTATGNSSLALTIEGVGFWASTMPGWPTARTALAGGWTGPAQHQRPSPAMLPAAERRRAPDSVALALQVASEAVAQSGRDPATLPSVFTSAYGDLALLDQLCTTLATQPTLLSPTKFHNSVHNAAAGYWTIGTGCRAPSSAVSAHRRSFAAGLLEAATQCVADHTPVLLVAYDAPSAGALASVACSESLLALALVLAPESLAVADGPRLQWSLRAPAPATAVRTEAARALLTNAMADALPLAEALSTDLPAAVTLALSPGVSLQLALTPN
jgi:hypothetical protein